MSMNFKEIFEKLEQIKNFYAKGVIKAEERIDALLGNLDDKDVTVITCGKLFKISKRIKNY